MLRGVAKCPAEYCKSTVDVILKSSDGELFGAHQRNLEMYTEGFPIAGSTVVSEPVLLEESAEVLRLLLKYTHHMRQPCLDDIPFTLLASLAEAVEKYMIYSAMEVCKIKMTLATSALADEAAKLTLKNSSSEFLVRIREAGLHDDVAFRWLRYRDRWMTVLVQMVLAEPTSSSLLPKGGFESCSTWPPFQFSVIKQVSQDLSNLDDFSDTVDLHKSMLDDCRICRLRCSRWVTQVQDKIEKLPKFSKI